MTKKKQPIRMSVREYNEFTGRKPDDTYVHRLIRNGKDLPFVAKTTLVKPSAGSSHYMLTMVADFDKIRKKIDFLEYFEERKHCIKSLLKRK